jgi:hypothetical protein
MRTLFVLCGVEKEPLFELYVKVGVLGYPPLHGYPPLLGYLPLLGFVAISIMLGFSPPSLGCPRPLIAFGIRD